ncbi:MAG: hypothetical protein WKG32_08590 [Gemmatimonadaceae bacterium]
MTVDVNTFVGGYPFRHLPHPDAAVLVRVLEREGVKGAWVGHLPSAFYRDPSPGNEALLEQVAPYRGALSAVPTVRPDWPKWERELAAAHDAGAPAVRAYPPQWGLGSSDASMRALAAACGEAGVALLLTVRFEDLRQRHSMDGVGDLPPATIRALARVSEATHLVITAAGRATVEEVHWGLTPEERSRVWWDISWIWGPPDDDLAHLFRTVGAGRFVYGSGWPLRLTQTPRANLDLLPDELAGAALGSVGQIARVAR